jgi:hypothetical protein
MGRSDAKPHPSGLADAGNFTPSSQPPDKDVKATSQDPGLAAKYGGFKGGKRAINRAKMGSLGKTAKDGTKGY